MKRLAICALGLLFLAGACVPLPPPPGQTDDGTETTGAGDVSDAALSYAGDVSGSVASTSSTGSDTGSSARLLAAQQIAGGVLWLEDLDGNRLKDANGELYPEYPYNADGTFALQGLPVGVEFVMVVDIDGDGTPDMQTVLTIPKNEDADSGALEGALVDPLSTLVHARIRALLAGSESELDALGISLAGLVQRIRDAFENLFADSGIDAHIALDQIRGRAHDELVSLFEALVPSAAQRGMRMAESNLALASAKDVDAVVRAAARILVEGGFVIADEPQGVDLSFLADLPHVETASFHDFFEMNAPPPIRSAALQSGQDFPPPPGEFEPVLYISKLAEVDRNFAQVDDFQQEHHGPIFSEHMLARMAEAFLAGRTISLRDLHRVVVDAETGLGARLTYPKHSPTGDRPIDVFETADGQGTERDMQQLFLQLQELDGFDPGPQAFEQHQAAIRALMRDFLAGTAEPSFERLFGAVLMKRVPSPEAFSKIIRKARAHLPFSRSGPSQWYVVATADPFNNSAAAAVTVDIQADDRGRVTRVTYNAAGNGAFYLGFGPMTETGMETELINRRNGRWLHDFEGVPQRLDMADGSIFQPVNGQSFFDAFSETGTNYPGAPALRISNPGFDPSRPPDPETNPPDFELFVLMTDPGPDGEPVRVNYANGVATYNPDGAYYMAFTGEPDSGLFELVDGNGQPLEMIPGDYESRVRVAAGSVQGIVLAPQTFTHVFGIQVPNPGYDPDGAPYYDDINGNGQHDANEPLFDWRPFLNDPGDWRSTWVEKHYRRADNNGFPNPMDIDWGSDTPRTHDGVALVPRNIRPRLNAFRFGRPNVTLNLLMAFSPPEFFDGTHALDVDTRVNPFTALAFVNLVFDSIHNVTATVDFDGPDGPEPPHQELIDAHVFVLPIGDPLRLFADGFDQLTR